MKTLILVLCVSFFLQQTGCEELVNIALHKKPTQNGTLEYPRGTFWDVSHSVDGMTECTQPVTGQNYSATVDALDPWWQLDLGSIYTIRAMHLLGRPDTHKQLGGFRLWSGLDNETLQMVYTHNITAYNNGRIWVNNTMPARVIKIDLPRDNTTDRIFPGPLTLCEVEVLISSAEHSIKLTSTTSGSAIYGSFGPNRAIDGKYPSAIEITPELCNCCSITTGNGTLWWTIDFGHPRLIGRVYITGRKDGNNEYQSKDLSIFISNTAPSYELRMLGELVWNITNSTHGYVFPYTFEEPRLFQYMTIARLDQGSSFMTICEVDFLTTACQSGFYGDKCSASCGNCYDGPKKCLTIDGKCPTGCAQGYNYTRDAKCKTECDPGSYGERCQGRCGNCNDGKTTCSTINGTCPAGCLNGYDYTKDKTCNAVCSAGQYGHNCLENCGQCINGNTTCFPANGECKDGCAPGYNHTDRTCHTKCNSGYYGNNCTETCGHCIDGNTMCSVTDGTCQKGCAPGYYETTNRLCNTTCQYGLFGVNCSRACGRCLNGSTCLVTDGTCTAGCSPGFDYTVNRTCNNKCHPGRYGLNCSEICGHCIKTNTCNETDGACPTTCADGYDYTANRKCTTECKPGHYGLDCRETCGYCIGGSNCSHIDGTCSNSCASGYDYEASRMCKTECKSGYYGLYCKNPCGNCTVNTTCNFDNGFCPTGCAPGYNRSAGLTCHLECANGTYGQDCRFSCGSCSGGRTVCLKTNGYCPQGECSERFTGETCDEEISETSDVKTIVGVVVGIVVLVIIAVGLVFVLKRRGLLFKRKAECTNGKNDSEFVNLEALARERSNQTKKVGTAATSDELNTSHENGGYYSFNPGEHVTNSINVQKLWEYITKNRANNFEDLFVEFQAMPGGSQFECFVAQRDENLGKNKYRNMYPYDHCRVKLKVPEGQADYINASHVDGYERVQKFIAAQGPQKGTIEDFWLMVWQQGARKVVMLTNISEMGKDKCEQYWPDDGASIQYGGILVTSKETTEKSDYISRKFELRMEHAKVRRVEQFHFKSWPDKDVPDSTWSLVSFWRVAMNSDQGKSPIVVHCSAGIGRTGTFIALDSLYHQAMTEGGIRPMSVIETLRRQRINMVQTKYQYAFLHEAVADALLVGTHYLWASQLPSVCNFFSGRNPEATVTRAHQQFKLICECIASSDGQKQVSSSTAAENIYEETGEPMAEPEYGNISTLQSEISEYRPKTKDRNSASIQQLNAIYLPNYAEASTYILAETPSESSLPDFWSLVEEQNVTTIVNLTETTHPYFQTSCTLGANGGKPVGRFVVNVVKEVKHKEYIIRSIVYKEQDKTENNAGFTVKMFSLSAWQQGAECPSDLDPLIALLEEVNKWHPYVSEAKPVLFICADGRTRCGLVAAILNESQRMRNEEGHVNIVETAMTMKKRAGHVISAEQFQLLYEAVLAYALRMGYVLDTGNYNNN